MLDIKDCCCIQETDVEKAKEEIRQKEIQIKEMQERLKKEFGIDVTKTEEDDGISQYIKETKQRLKRQEEERKNGNNLFSCISKINFVFAIASFGVLIFVMLYMVVVFLLG